MSLLIGQDLEIADNGIVRLINKMNNDAILKENYEVRKAVGRGSGSGFPRVASLDVTFLENEPTGLGRAVLEARSCTADFRVALRNFLERYPDFKTSDAKI